MQHLTPFRPVNYIIESSTSGEATGSPSSPPRPGPLAQGHPAFPAYKPRHSEPAHMRWVPSNQAL